MSRIEAGSCLVFSILLVFLTYPVVVSRRPMRALDRICLVGATVAFGLGGTAQGHTTIWIGMAVCLALLVVLWFRYRGKHHRRSCHEDAAVETAS